MTTDPQARQHYARRYARGRNYCIQQLLIVSMIAWLVVMMTACGKKSPPKPPEGELLPPTVSDLTANVSDDKLELSWTVPPTTARYPLPASGFQVLAFKVSRGELCPDCPPDFKPIGNLKVLGQLDKAAGKQAMRFRYPLDIGYRYTITVRSVAEDGSVGAESKSLKVDH